jgi:hypothetical protein
MRLKFECSIKGDAISISVFIQYLEVARYEIKGSGQSFRVFTAGSNEKHPDLDSIPLAIDYVKAHAKESLLK